MGGEWDIVKLMSSIVYSNAEWERNDVSYFKVSDDKYLAVGIDTLVASTDAPPGMSLRQVARKAAVSVVSDLSSKGVKPEAMLFSVSIPRGCSLSEVREIAEGLRMASEEYGFKLIGGDTNESTELSITCCGFGLTGKRIYRSGARPGDLVVVTGLFGLQRIGLKILMDNLPPSDKLDEIAVDLVLNPRAKLIEGLIAASTGAVTASIDSSDGLSISLHEISELSGVRIVVDRVPAHPGVLEKCKEYGLDYFEAVFGCGEEFELIFTVKRGMWGRLRDEFKRRGLSIHRIGYVEEGSGVFIEEGGVREKIKRVGWQHLK